MRAEINQYEGQDTAELRQEYTQAGATYDIIEGDKVHDLTEDNFQHHVGLLRNILHRRKLRSDFERIK